MKENNHSMNVIWEINKWSPNLTKIESQPCTINNTNFICSIDPSNKANKTLAFSVTQKPNASKDTTNSAKDIQLSISFIDNNFRPIKTKIQIGSTTQSVETDIPISEFNDRYTDKKVCFALSYSQINREGSGRKKSSRLNNKPSVSNPLSTISSPTRHQSVSKMGKYSSNSNNSNVTSQNSMHSKNPIRNKGAKLVTPNVGKSKEKGSKAVPIGSRKTSSNKLGRQTNDFFSSDNYMSSNASGIASSGRGRNAGSDWYAPRESRPKKQLNASPMAAIAAAKNLQSQSATNSSSNASIVDVKTPASSSVPSPSASIARNSSLKAANQTNSAKQNQKISSSSSNVNSNINSNINSDLNSNINSNLNSNVNSNASSVASPQSKKIKLPSPNKQNRVQKGEAPQIDTESKLPSIHNPRNSHLHSNKDAPSSEEEKENATNANPPAKVEDIYAGLANQGATCYMNSVLQSLFHIPVFRQLVFEIPTEDDADKEHSIPLNLQALFCNLFQTSKQATEESEKKADEDGFKPISYVKPVSTKSLTKSFGWNSYETFQQQDIQEFFRVLLNKLDDKIDEKNKKNKENSETDNQDVKHVSDIFKGQTIYTISGETTGFCSERFEDFYDLSVSVKDCLKLEKSFEQFTKKEQLSDSYDTGIEGEPKIAVNIQAQIFKLPEVLTLHLQRFEYDFVHDALTKINDELSFPKILDMTPFLHEKSPFKESKDSSSKFTLIGVLIHSGDASFGHYYVYLRPKIAVNETNDGIDEENSSFYMFNDSSVRKVTDEEAIDDNFGGYEIYSTGKRRTKTEKTHSAYMLIYARNDRLHQIYDFKYEIPAYIQEYAKTCNYNAKSNKKVIMILNEDAIKMNTKEGKFGVYNENNLFNITVNSNSSYEDIYAKVSEFFQTDVRNIRLWNLDYMKDIDDPLPESSRLPTRLPKIIFMQNKPETEPIEVSKTDILIFVKLFTRNNNFPILFAYSTIWSKDLKIKELKRQVCGVLQIPSNANVRLFEELVYPTSSKQYLNELSNDESNLYSFHTLKNGSSILVETSILPPDEIFSQIAYTFNDSKDNDYFGEVVSYVNYMVSELPESVVDYVDLKRKVRRVRLFDYKNYGNPNFIRLDEGGDDEDYDLREYGTIEFPLSIDLNELCKFISSVFKVNNFTQEKDELLLFRYTSILEGPTTLPLKSISEIHRKTRYLYVLPYPKDKAAELKNKMTVNVFFSDDSFNLKYCLFAYLNSSFKVSSILNGLSWIKINDHKPKLRALQMTNSLILKKLTGEETVSIFNDSVLRIDVEPNLEKKNGVELKEINVCNAVVCSNSNSSFSFIGFPFLLIVAKDETVDETRKRIQKYLKWSTDKMSHVRLYAGSKNENFNINKVLKKTQIIFDEVGSDQLLIMIHSSEDSYRNDYASSANGVQIH